MQSAATQMAAANPEDWDSPPRPSPTCERVLPSNTSGRATAFGAGESRRRAEADASLRPQGSKCTARARTLETDAFPMAYLVSDVNPVRYDACRSEERRVGKECRSRWS